MSGLRGVPLDLDEANAFVARHHRHHRPVVGHKFSIGAAANENIVGVVIVGRPVSRMRDDGQTLEVTRLCTDGTRNACSFLYGAAARAGFALGYSRIGTYTLPEEGGASLRGAGWKLIGERGGGSWGRKERPRVDKAPMQGKLLWEALPLPSISGRPGMNGRLRCILCGGDHEPSVAACMANEAGMGERLTLDLRYPLAPQVAAYELASEDGPPGDLTGVRYRGEYYGIKRNKGGFRVYPQCDRPLPNREGTEQ